ncbi:STAS domain-containing protein [Bacillus sp. FJAT-44742]|uniref:STAS domain-containing protein n=1 Tax=Bacillus sp. FJAT-44742 TaxID=2014005 RepID=UPI000C233FAC|nr:STAS domain-containing protein [Bacillus sp. FJAT-44742]
MKNFSDYFLAHQEQFIKELFASISEEILELVDTRSLLGKKHLMETSRILVLNLGVREQEEILKTEAQKRGVDWAHSNLEIHAKLEFFTAFRNTYWIFRKSFHESHEENGLTFELEHTINYAFHQFINEYVKSYTDTKNKVIAVKQQTINELILPIIPLTSRMAILPLMGAIDGERAERIQERILHYVSTNQLDHVIFDFNGIGVIDTAVIAHIFEIVKGLSLMGCQSIIVGITPSIASSIVHLGVGFGNEVLIKSSLQQVIKETFFL